MGQRYDCSRRSGPGTSSSSWSRLRALAGAPRRRLDSCEWTPV